MAARIVVAEFVSLDGLMEASGGEAAALNVSSPISTPISPSTTNEYSYTVACVCGGAASTPGSKGCSTT